MEKNMSNTITKEEVFTPLLSTDRTQRVEVPMSKVEIISGDINKRGLGKKAVVKLFGMKELFDVIGIDCSLPSCACDCYVKPQQKVA